MQEEIPQADLCSALAILALTIVIGGCVPVARAALVDSASALPARVTGVRML